MDFTSIPIYQDPPNWPQQQLEASSETSQLPLAPPPPDGGGGSGGGDGSKSSIRQGSMTERARLAYFPPPEASLKCPRCESTNTKFCYYNNYNLSQPRYFCRTCRRYWTRGGALRNVPVGGGSRRNKRSKRSSNCRTKSLSKDGGYSRSSNELASNSCTNDILGLKVPPPLQIPILPPLQSLGEVGLNLTRIQPQFVAVNGGDGMEFYIGANSSMSGGGGGGSFLSSRLVDQWGIQHFSSLANLESPFGGLSLLDGPGIDHDESQNYIGGEHKSKQLEDGFTNVKMEENQGLNLVRNSLGVYGYEQCWGSNAWSGFVNHFSPS